MILEDIPCPHCDALGMQDDQSCPYCAGSGHLHQPAAPLELEVAENPFLTVCTACRGGTAQSTCRRCRGKGVEPNAIALAAYLLYAETAMTPAVALPPPIRADPPTAPMLPDIQVVTQHNLMLHISDTSVRRALHLMQDAPPSTPLWLPLTMVAIIALTLITCALILRH